MKLVEFMGKDVFRGRVIALDGKDGRTLFDTSKNRKDYIAQFLTGTILYIWAEMRETRKLWHATYEPVLVLLLSHNSWEEGEAE